MRRDARERDPGAAGHLDAGASPAGVVLVLVSIVSLQGGTAFAKTLFAIAGVVGVVFMRNAFSAVVLWALARPAPRTFSARHWRYAVCLGVVTAAMNLTFYEAASRVPIGIAVAIGFLGPITVAVLRSRRRWQLVWPAMAYCGVVLLTPIGEVTSIDAVGVLIALGNAVCWGLYVVLTARTSSLFGQLAGLTVSSTISALVMVPLLIATDLAALGHPRTLALGFGMAMLATTVPYICDYIVLRRMPQHVYGVLLSLEPAVAAVLGLIVLDETLGVWEWLAIALVMTAAAGSTSGVVFRRSRRTPSPETVARPDNSGRPCRAGSDR